MMEVSDELRVYEADRQIGYVDRLDVRDEGGVGC